MSHTFIVLVICIKSIRKSRDQKKTFPLFGTFQIIVLFNIYLFILVLILLRTRCGFPHAVCSKKRKDITESRLSEQKRTHRRKTLTQARWSVSMFSDFLALLHNYLCSHKKYESSCDEHMLVHANKTFLPELISLSLSFTRLQCVGVHPRHHIPPSWFFPLSPVVFTQRRIIQGGCSWIIKWVVTVILVFLKGERKSSCNPTFLFHLIQNVSIMVNISMYLSFEPSLPFDFFLERMIALAN